MNEKQKNTLVSQRNLILEYSLIINKSLYNKGTIAKSTFLHTQDIILKLISEEKQKIKNI